MQPPVETVRISQRGRDLLIKLKRNTGIDNWNILCRLGFFESIGLETEPPQMLKSEESNIEMTWKTFSGNYQNEILAILYLKSHNKGIRDRGQIAEYFKQHLERGLFLLDKKKDLLSIFQALQTKI